MDIFSEANNLIELLEQSGFEAYAVGGCVRDSIMNLPCHDVDITTSAMPLQTEDVLKNNNIKYVETGLKHGTITAIVEGEPFEITTYRKDGEYKDNRHPENVEFVKDIKEDLSRRDFTINALAYNKSKGVVDLFGGVEDIENKIIRAVGDADKRFNEDALRIMRAIRFASTLSFDIEENTKKAIFDNKELLKNVSVERLFAELSKLLLGDNVYDVLIEYKEVLAVIIPELQPTFDCQQINPWHIYDVWTHTCKAVASCPKDLELRLTMLLHDIGKPLCKTTDENGINHFKGHQAVSGDLSDKILKKLKVSKKICDYVLTLVPIHDITVSVERKNIKKWLNRLGEEYLFALLQVKRADKLAQNPEKTVQELKNLEIISSLITSIIESQEAFKVTDLEINGNDLISLGLKGKAVGNALNTILERVINSDLENNKEKILVFVKSQLL